MRIESILFHALSVDRQYLLAHRRILLLGDSAVSFGRGLALPDVGGDLISVSAFVEEALVFGEGTGSPLLGTLFVHRRYFAQHLPNKI